MLALIFYVLNGTANFRQGVAIGIIKIFVPTIGSFLAVWLLLKQLKEKANFTVPSWLFISVFGIWLALTIRAIIADWTNPQQDATLAEYVGKAVAGFELFGFFSFVILPLTASIHYFGGLLRLLRS